MEEKLQTMNVDITGVSQFVDPADVEGFDNNTSSNQIMITN